MKRFRFTLLAICLVLAWLGYHDLSLFFRNPDPLSISISELEQTGAPREWLNIEGGYLDLEQAINPSGQVETFESGPFFVPLVSNNDNHSISVVIETRRPEVLETLKRYVLDFDTQEARQSFLVNNRGAFYPQRNITGMTASWLTSTANRDKLLQLAREQNMPVNPEVVFVSEGKQPGKFRGFFFSIVAFLGFIKFIQMTNKKEIAPAIGSSEKES
ncbi:MAG: hypothetical protein C0623_01775 [Desulfuromonas sp.]|nr:MAG: hypothetical protein C0623_01775 [Desulfuromonas sp.]